MSDESEQASSGSHNEQDMLDESYQTTSGRTTEQEIPPIDILEKKKNIFSRVRLTKTKPAEQRKQNFPPNEMSLKDYTRNFLRIEPKPSLFSSFIDNIYSEDVQTQHQGLSNLRKLFIEELDATQKARDAGVTSRLLQFLDYDHLPYFQLEAVWVLSICTYDDMKQREEIMKHKVIPSLKKLLASAKEEMIEHVITVIGYLSNDSIRFRDILLHWGILDFLVERVRNCKTQSLWKDGIWAISNLCRGKSSPDLRFTRVALSTVCKALINEMDEEIITNATWTLSSLARDGGCIDDVLASGIIPVLIANLLQEPRIIYASVRTLGNLMLGTEKQIDAILSYPELLPSLVKLLTHRKKFVRRELCWTLSNIAVSSIVHIAQLIDTPNCLSNLFFICQNEDSPEVSREAFWALSNMTAHGSDDQVTLLLEKGIFNLFVLNMCCPNPETASIVIIGLINILKRKNLSFENKKYFPIENVEDGWETFQELRSSSPEKANEKRTQLGELYDHVQKRFPLEKP